MLYKYSRGRELAEHYLVNFTHLNKKTWNVLLKLNFFILY